MSFRNRPVLNRKHRPRWQDELRSQQLIVIGFAAVISVAVGIFAATAWSGYYATHLRQLAVVSGHPITRNDLERQMNMLGAELQASAVEYAGRAGGARDPVVQQQLSAIQQELQAIVTRATDGLIDHVVLNNAAAQYGVTVADADLEAELVNRRTVPTILSMRLLLVNALPDDAEAGAEPTDADWARAEREANTFADQIRGGASFEELATAESDDGSASSGGLLGWIAEDDSQYGVYFEAARDAAANDLLGPTRGETGYWILRLEARRDEGPDQTLIDLLAATGITDVQYRDYVRDSLLRQAFRDFFGETVVGRYQPQRHVRQIFVAADQGVPVPKQRVRHFLAQPIPGAEDQSTATQEQWDAALARAEEFREAASAPNVDWLELAADSDDPGSRDRGGDLGWYDPTSGGFVPEFEEAMAGLQVGELSGPVRTDFGYHIIQITDTRTSAAEQVDGLVAELRAAPDTFEEVVRRDSEDSISAADGGDIGWVIAYQFEAARMRAIFDLQTPGEISDPAVTSNGYYIFQLIETSDAKYVLESKRRQVASTGFQRWLDELRDAEGIWIDPQFDTTAAAA